MIKKTSIITVFGSLIMLSTLLILPSNGILASPDGVTTLPPPPPDIFQNGQWNVTFHDQLVYNITMVNNGTAHHLDFIQSSPSSPNHYAGSLVQGNSFIYGITSLPDLAISGVVQAYMTGMNFTNMVNASYNLVTPMVPLHSPMGGPPFLFPVTPTLNATEYANFASQENNTGFNTTINSPSIFSIYFTNSTTTFNTTWSKTTGIMQYYYFNGTDPYTHNIITLELNFITDFNPEIYNPYFGLVQPIISYNFTKIDLFNNDTQQIQLYGNNNTYQGFFGQGQIAIVNIYSESFYQQPTYLAHIETSTGYVDFQGFNESNNGPGNGPPPFLEFLFPISTNSNYWNVIGLYMGAMGLHTLINNATTFSVGNPGHLQVIFNKNNGLMVSYFANMTFGNNMAGIMQLSLISASDMNNWSLSWGTTTGTINQYYIKTLNNEGNSTTQGNTGSIKEGQNMTITIDGLSNEFSSTSVDLATITGTASLNQSLGFLPIHVESHTPQLFYPVIPVESTGQAYQFLSDTFGAIGATIVNNATVFQVQLVNGHIDNYLVNIQISWNKTNGVLLYYHYTAVNTLNSSDIIDYELVFMGKVSQAIQPSSTPTLSTTPGFEFVWVIAGIVVLPIVFRKRKQ